MAPDSSGSAVELSNCHDYLEVDPLKLSAEHFPLPGSLQEMVLTLYAGSIPLDGHEQEMEIDELLGYLKNIDNFDLTPLAAILQQTEEIGDPLVPTAQHSAILQWLGTALDDWEQRFPIEEPLASTLRQLKPLAAALAVTDPDFLRPGAHPLHQLLDTLQTRAIGWQSQLGRAGQALEQQVAKVISGSLAWFGDKNVKLAILCTDFIAMAERDRERAHRMAQRVVETEEGRVKNAAAKIQAARMINENLAKNPAPTEIGEFLKGPWYSSAQLVLLKFGADSESWQSMTSTTETLLDSLQNVQFEVAEEAEKRRQYIFEVVTQLPKDMRHWLLSLHHDTEAVNDAMGLVEFAHLRVLRQQALELEQIEPITLPDDDTSASTADHRDELAHIKAEQWFSMDTGTGEPLRVQLALKVDPEQQLIFTNLAGIKVLQQSFAEFFQLLQQQRITRLHSGASFSLCLANAAGIKNSEAVDALMKTAPGPTAGDPGHAPASAPETQQPVAPRVEPQPTTETLSQPAAASPVEPQPTAETLSQPAAAPLVEPEPAAETLSQPVAAPLVEPEPAAETLSQPAPATTGQPQREQPAVAINLPMGAWLGFHDGDTPLIARLGLHDREQDNYIFVNREGMKLWEFTSEELLKLIDDGLVEILQTSSSFREEVAQQKSQLKQ